MESRRTKPGSIFLHDSIFFMISFFCDSGCPAGWATHGNLCYYIDDSPIQRMTDARQICQNLGAELSIIRSAKENDFISDLVKKLNKDIAVWLGLQRKADSKFYWIDGTPLEGHYQNWNRGEPNNARWRENCVHMYGTGYRVGKWNDLPCIYAAPSVLCQKSI